MCKAMNRSLTNVILGGWGTSTISAAASEADLQRTHTEISSDETADLLQSASKVIIVPGALLCFHSPTCIDACVLV